MITITDHNNGNNRIQAENGSFSNDTSDGVRYWKMLETMAKST